MYLFKKKKPPRTLKENVASVFLPLTFSHSKMISSFIHFSARMISLFFMAEYEKNLSKFSDAKDTCLQILYGRNPQITVKSIVSEVSCGLESKSPIVCGFLS